MKKNVSQIESIDDTEKVTLSSLEQRSAEYSKRIPFRVKL